MSERTERNSSFIHGVFDKSVERFRDDSSGVKYHYLMSLSLFFILIFKDKMDSLGCPSGKKVLLTLGLSVNTINYVSIEKS